MYLALVAMFIAVVILAVPSDDLDHTPTSADIPSLLKGPGATGQK